ncbi:glycoside hydrolase family 35 protein [Micromonospora sp. DT227]|uniref:glycoside hydrolase family 35 protein n=1 Tax=Micromonospora sp. DT227 TaxID=3393433 RepID=UPI003CEE1B3F
MTTFDIGATDFLLDGRPFRVLSGALHYFRVHPELWRDRIRKARQMGLNTIETYVCWQAHSPQRGVFRTDGGLDLGRFLDLVAEEGMYAFVRPGPYICAEWDNGGLPAWLFRDATTGIRRTEPRYLDAVTEYYEALAPILVPRQIDAGGPLILVQVENEYGAYGDDRAYLRTLTELTRRAGVTVPLTTVDQPVDHMLRDGGLPELHRTASFGSRPGERLATLRAHQPTGPLMCAEFWDGWFDHWGGHHHTTDVDQAAADLDALLSSGASVNIYMFHGGTNFGFTNGANDKGTYQPVVTSYDYDAPLDEAGTPTAKYWAFREVIARHADVPPAPPAAPTAPAPPVEARFTRSLALWDVLDLLGQPSTYPYLPTADDIGQYTGFTLYTPHLPPSGHGVLSVAEVRDRAQVFVDRRSRGVLSRDHGERMIGIRADDGDLVELLVEDLGRVNYGPRTGEPKGLIGPAGLDGATIDTWTVRPLRLDDIDTVARAVRDGHPVESSLSGPVFCRAEFAVTDPGRDLFLDTSSWGKGVAWINGFCLGRYWSRGPQRTLYVPAPLLRTRHNEIVVLELHAARPSVRLLGRPALGHTEH